MITETVAPK